MVTHMVQPEPEARRQARARYSDCIRKGAWARGARACSTPLLIPATVEVRRWQVSCLIPRATSTELRVLLAAGAALSFGYGLQARAGLTRYSTLSVGIQTVLLRNHA